jgi:hypothetical protein
MRIELTFQEDVFPMIYQVPQRRWWQKKRPVATLGRFCDKIIRIADDGSREVIKDRDGEERC